MSLFKSWDECTPAEQLERWQNCERVLVSMTEHQRKRHFNMGTWALKNECGTIGCAAGLCSLDKWFIKQGFQGIFTKDPGESNWYFKFANGIFPHIFFGSVGVQSIFTNEKYIDHRGARIHKTVVAAVRRYIKELKANV